VGVDVNTASPALLGYVSGMNQLTARRVYEHRMRNGPFRNREQLRDVPGFGDATFVQAAGFLKIAHSVNPLDATWIHPESYDTAGQVLQLLGGEPHDLRLGSGTERLAAKVSEIDVEAKAAELGIGTLLLRDILAQLTRPGRDPREDLPAPIFKRDVLKFEDLEPNMALTGTVLNVVDFGCFVDIGMHDSGLIHVSQLANRFVQDPHDVVAVGDIVHVWVMQVDKERRRVSLTMVDPNAQRASRERRGRGRGRNRPATPQGEQAQAGSSQAGATQQGEKPTGQKSGPPRRRERGGRDRQRSGGGRPPGKGGRGRGRDRGGPPRERGPYETKPKGPPPPPLSEDMKAGKEPMRTFGDLMQFYQEKETEEEKPEQKPEANQEDPETKSDD